MRELAAQERLIWELENKQIKLRKMAHSKWCKKHHNECPETHVFCKPFLNPKTSIAWGAANLISDFLSVAFLPETKKKLFFALRTLEHVVYRHYQKEWKLYCLIQSVGNDFISLIDWKE